jgi:hypothetical protein
MSDYDLNQDLIKELDTVYKRIGMLANHIYHTTPANLSDESEVSYASHMKRCDDITKYLEGEGYKYDWFKGWTK